MTEESRPSLSDCSPEVLNKAARLVAAEAVAAAGKVSWGESAVKHVYRVTGSRGDAYQVAVLVDDAGPVWATCGCPYGTHSQKFDRIGCSHVAAVLMTL